AVAGSVYTSTISVSGAGGVEINSGGNANNYQGAWIVNNGVLELDAAYSLGVGNPVTVNGGWLASGISSGAAVLAQITLVGGGLGAVGVNASFGGYINVSGAGNT